METWRGMGTSGNFKRREGRAHPGTHLKLGWRWGLLPGPEQTGPDSVLRCEGMRVTDKAAGSLSHYLTTWELRSCLEAAGKESEDIGKEKCHLQGPKLDLASQSRTSLGW